MKQGEGFWLFTAVLPDGKGTAALHLAEEQGAIASTVLLGRGTIASELLNRLGFVSCRKEILLALIPALRGREFVDVFSARFHFEKPDHGIAYTMSVGRARGQSEKEGGQTGMSYACIFIIVNKGMAESAVEVSKRAGATGGTILHGRGAGSRDKLKLFDFEIEPEKEILMILAPSDRARGIADAVEQALELGKPGSGIVFIMDVSHVAGLYGM